MTLHELAAIADGKAPLPTGPVDVRLPGRVHPLLRTLTRVEWKIEPDGRWLYWRWAPERLPEGDFDCGYSGAREDSSYWNPSHE